MDDLPLSPHVDPALMARAAVEVARMLAEMEGGDDDGLIL